MIKYHNTPNGPRICTANVRDCKYGGKDSTHYENFADAQKDYEKTMENAFGKDFTLSKTDKVSQEAHKAMYESREQLKAATQRTKRKINKKLVETVKLVKANPKVQELNSVFNHLVNEARVAHGLKKQQLNNFKTRAVAGYRVNRMRAKSLVSTSQNKFRAVKGSANVMKDALVARKNAEINRARDFVQEGKGRLKAASELQIEAVRALRKDSPQLQQQKRALELKKLSDSANHGLPNKVIEDYFEKMIEAKAQAASHRSGEVKYNATPGQGKRRKQTVDV